MWPCKVTAHTFFIILMPFRLAIGEVRSIELYYNYLILNFRLVILNDSGSCVSSWISMSILFGRDCIGNGLDGLFYRIPYGSNYSECLFSSLVTLQSLRLLVYSSPKNFPSDEAKYFEFSGKFTIDVLSSSGE